MTLKTADYSSRNLTIDILRAVTMLLMIFVNDLFTVKGYPEWFRHAAADEDFLGLSDVVFPSFLFVVGLSIPYAIEGRFLKGVNELSTVAHILTRSVALILMGVFTVNTESGLSAETGMSVAVYKIIMIIAFFMVWNAYPRTNNNSRKIIYNSLQAAGLIVLLVLAILFRDKNGNIFSPRWWGILGLIGWAYLFSAFTYLFARKNFLLQFIIFLLLCILCFVQTPLKNGAQILDFGKGNFFNSFIDLIQIRNGAHPALVMAGVLFTMFTVNYNKGSFLKKSGNLLLLALAFGLLAFVTNQFTIISKLQASLPWVFYSIAITIVLYTIIQWLVHYGKTKWFYIIKPAGTATLTCYLVPYVVYSIINITGFQWPSWMLYGVAGVFKCFLYAMLIIGITALLIRKGIKLKI